MKKWLIHEVRLPVGTPETTLLRAAARKLGIAPEEVQDWGIVRKSLDARKKDSLAYKYSLWVQADAAAHWMQKRGAAPYEAPVIPEPNEGEKPLDGRILVVGAGPASNWLSRAHRSSSCRWVKLPARETTMFPGR